MDDVLQILPIVVWPVAVTIIGVFFLFYYRGTISAWLKNLTIKHKETTLTPTSGKQSLEKNTGQDAAKPSSEPKKTTPPTMTPAEESWRASAYLWEYRYLNYFLVPRTQSVLEWFKNITGPVNAALFDSFWIPIIQDPKEREAIVEVLLSHHLIQNENGLFSLSPKGREYIEFRGPLNIKST